MNVQPTPMDVPTVVQISLVLMTASVLMDSNSKLTSTGAKVRGKNVALNNQCYKFYDW